ncbi:enoyl-CoA hydratase/carnithine racemase [Nocardioides daedukensis]|uniref:Enoyl-CoA hydratase/carnithine racemase n=1 Tax=Nocardioides daedukensis TaxID=634462 RepID=A0A7Y9S4C9_9ACTN|nr:enoyl-CoA hydratase-related protein [Nocardioides daedukensis]NYG59873.1 enoyl-CoA hydratase/carnithine racemase [Nocardioides daedukensis]
MSSLVVEDREHIRILTLSRPERRNAIDQGLAEELSAAFDAIEADRSVRAVILTGGPSFFCAGTDLASEAPPRTEAGGPYGFLARVRRTPLIAAVEGFAFGGGFECVLASDLVVAAQDARFAAPEVKRGVVANTGALFRAGVRLPFNVATEMLLTGDPLGAERAHEVGFVNVLTAPGGTLDAALDLAGRVGANSPDAVSISLGAVAQEAAQREEGGWRLTAQAEVEIAQSPNRAEGVTAFFEKRPPRWS